MNVGKLLIGEKDGFAPCTPAGVQELLVRYGIDTRGKEVVIVGRSNIVGKPMAALLIQSGAGADGTVTVCHSRTRDLAFHTKRADIVIAAIGRPEMLTGDMIRPGAVVIDVGINRDDNGKLCGDVDFDAVKDIAGAITPVPGGVGPMTIACLLANTLTAAACVAAALTTMVYVEGDPWLDDDAIGSVKERLVIPVEPGSGVAAACEYWRSTAPALPPRSR